MATVNIRIDDNLKKETEELCKDLGLNMTTAVTMFFKKMVREQRIPFDVSLYNQKLMTAIDNVENGKNLSKRFDTVQELIEDLTNEKED